MRSASVTATITGSGPQRWVNASVTIRSGIPQFAIHGVCKDVAVSMRHMVRKSFEKSGKRLPSGAIVADMDFEVPFEGIQELSITLATAILLASEQISGVMLKDALLTSSHGERIRMSCS